VLVGLFSGTVADTIHFITHDHLAGHGEICLAVVNRPIRQLRGVEFVDLVGEDAKVGMARPSPTGTYSRAFFGKPRPNRFVLQKSQ
jgi:hypothetical protein